MIIIGVERDGRVKEFLKNKKFLLGIGIVITIGIAVVTILLLSKPDKPLLPETSTSEYMAYVKINPLVKLEYKQTCRGNDCDAPIVTDYELVNDDAKDIYKDIDIIGTNNNLLAVLHALSQTAKDNNLEFSDVQIYSNWNNLENYIDTNKEEYNWSYIINFTNKETLEKLPELLETEKILYTIKFDTDGGSEIGDTLVEERDTIVEPSIPTKKGYVFIEWQVDGKKFDFKEPITGNMTLRAVWKKEDVIVDKPNNNSNTNDKKEKYLNFWELDSLEKIKGLETEYNITIKLIETGDECNAYLQGGDQLIVPGKTYTVYVTSIDPFVQGGGCGDVGQGDAGYEEIDACEVDETSEECFNKRISATEKETNPMRNTNIIYYNEKEIYSSTSVVLRDCYNEFSCNNTEYVTIYSFNKTNIQAMSKEHIKILFYWINNSPEINSVDLAQQQYNKVISRDYVNKYKNTIAELEGIIEQYKDTPFPTEGACTTNLGCFLNANDIRDEIDNWQKVSLEKAEQDLADATEALQSTKEFDAFLKSLIN